jgi:hypothetical protein
MKTIDKFYSRFGEDVKGVVYAKAKPDGDIKHLLIHLGLPVSGIIDRQHRILVDFIHTYGKSLFIKAVGLSGGAIAVKKLIQDTELAKIKQKRDRMRMAQLQGVPLNDSAPAVERVLVSEATAENMSPVDPIWIQTPTYSGPERRKGADRRVGHGDRRITLELITFKNRRFGGKRRKGPRRATDI